MKSPISILTLGELLRSRAEERPHLPAYVDLVHGEQEGNCLTYAGLYQQATAIAAWLQALHLAGQRVLLLYPPGLEFVAGFFGCQLAGVVAVPCPVPRPNRGLTHLRAVIADAQPQAVLSTSEVMTRCRPLLLELATLPWLTEGAEQAEPADLRSVAADGDSLAYLQYTSGSTTAPRGVMISHRNVLANLACLHACFRQTADSVSVTWLPHFHDMGLVDGILYPLYVGCRAVLMAPAAFVQRPLRWLQAISRYRATHSGGPNVAYELCLRDITPDQRANLDLACWESAYNGAEPVRAPTLQRFADFFAPCGFTPAAFCPAYGLAEATLMVSGGERTNVPAILSVAATALTRHEVRPVAPDDPDACALVGCGPTWQDTRVQIVRPETQTPCGPGEVGEIWVAGASVAAGYWGRAEQTEGTFAARLASGGDDGRYLRTGDLGFVHEGELFITGRLKDLVIIDGRNHYPQDFEWTVGKAHPLLQRDMSAAFAVDDGAGEQLVVVAEIHRHHEAADLAAAAASIRRAVAEEHEVPVHSVVLIRTGSLPRTSSGKVQRQACRAAWQAGGLSVVYQWIAGGEIPAQQAPARPEQARAVDAVAIQQWIIAQLAEFMRADVAQIDRQRPFTELGLSSRDAVRLSGRLEQWLGRRLTPTLVYEYPTISALARHLAGECARPRTMPHEPAPTTEPIAIVGIGCRFPGAAGPQAFWQLLCDEVDAVTRVPPGRWPADDAGWGGFLPHVDEFDPQFFNIAPREAARMDPQQRLLLEVAWEALEDAGQVPSRLANSPTGVFVGIATSDYGLLQLSSPALADSYAATGSALSIAANRLSYFLDLRGPSLAVDTACSSSLVAIHLACESLRRGECSLALAGGVNVILSPTVTANFARAGFMAADGRCKAFDARADGYVRGEGAGLVVLKPLAQARADGDTIYAMIRGSAVNQDGRSNGLTAPNPHAQEAVLCDAYRKAGVAPSQIGYVEAHGTGTLLGDPIEAQALARVVGNQRPADNPCRIGSVKTNIGHLEAAAGIAGLIKAALILKHQSIPASLHFDQPNPHIPFAELGLQVVRQQTSLPRQASPALAGVSSFGFGGTNAHVVLQGAPATAAGLAADVPYLLAISARTATAREELARNFRERLGDESGTLRDLCYTAAVRRAHHEHRLALVGDSRQELIEKLNAFLQGEARTGMSSGHAPATGPAGIVFVYSGQGAQWLAMGRQLLTEEPVFRRAVEECDALFHAMASWSIRDELLADETCSHLRQTAYAQPALFAVQVALTTLWRSWGITPAAVVGHSLGEVAAAHVAGALGLEDALRVLHHRSRLMQRLAGQGKMAAVGLGPAEARAALVGYEGRLCIGAINSPQSVVLSGDAATLAEVLAPLQARDVFCRPLAADAAYHSPLMTPIRDELVDALQTLRPERATLPIYSTVLGGRVQGTEFDAAYWGRNLCECVQFARAADALIDDGHTLFLEQSPHPVLAVPLRHCLSHRRRAGTVLASLRNGTSDRGALLEALGALYAEGHDPRWPALFPDGGQCVRLPSYPWQRERCWLDATEATTIPQATGHPFLQHHLQPVQSPHSHFWETDLHPDSLAYLQDHQLAGAALMPASAFLEAAWSAGRQQYQSDALTLADFTFPQPLRLAQGNRLRLQCHLSCDDREPAFQVHGQSDASGKWTLHAAGKVQPIKSNGRVPDVSLQAAQRHCQEEWSSEAFYRRLDGAGFQYGPSFRGVTHVWRAPGQALGKVRMPPGLEATPACAMHPALLDACFQVLAAALPDAGPGLALLLAEIQRVCIHRKPGPHLWSHAHVRRQADATCLADVSIFDADGALAIEVNGLCLRAAPTRTVPAHWLYDLAWDRHDLPQGASSAPLRSPAELAPVLEPSVSRLMQHAQHDQRSGRPAALDALCTAYIRDALRQLGWQPSHGDCFSTAALGARLGIVPRHQQLFARLLTILREDGVLAGDEGRWQVAATANGQDSAWPRPIASADPDVALLERCGRGLASVLRGTTDPLEIVFPQGDCSAVEAIYQDTPSARLANELLSQAVAAALPASTDGRPIRILEVGAGTGGTTAYLFQHLPTSKVEYVFSDVSPIFLNRAQGKFSSKESVAYRLVDIEQPPESQELADGDFDIIVAANVIHATADLRRTLGHLQRLLRPGGLLAVLEVTGKPRWLDLVFGLMNGWWKFKDVDLRPAHPLLAVAQWEAVLASSGFGDVVALPAAATQSTQAVFLARKTCAAPQHWWIFPDQIGVSAELARLLRARGHEAVILADGSALPAGPAAGLIDLRSLDARSAERGQPADLDCAVSLCASLAGTVGSLARHAMPPRLWLVTRGAQVIGGAGSNPVAATLWGMGRALAQEHPSLWGGLVDLDPAASATDAARQLHDQLGAAGEDQVAFRGASRYVARLAPRPPVAPIGTPALPIRNDATYLVTGGLGGLGTEVARWLVAQGASWLVLVGRSAHSPNGPDLARELQSQGAQVVAVSADVADESALRRMLDSLAEHGAPPVRGVIHAAGVMGAQPLIDLDPASLAAVLRPKVQGTAVLDRIFAEAELDFFVCFSSAAALLGILGQGMAAYAAANCYLDSLALLRRQQGRPWLSINWGVWDRVGKAATESQVRRLAARGFPFIDPASGLAVLRHLLGGPAGQAVVLPADWPAVCQSFPAASRSALLTQLVARPTTPVAGDATGLRLSRQDLIAVPAPERTAAARLSGPAGGAGAQVAARPAGCPEAAEPARTGLAHGPRTETSPGGRHRDECARGGPAAGA